MQPKIDKPIKFYARASKTARREILNIGLRGPDDLKLRIFRNAADSCATRRASLMRHGLSFKFYETAANSVSRLICGSFV